MRTTRPCRKHRQSIALMAAGVLEASAADRLRQHVKGCAGCQQYFAEIGAVTKQLGAPAPLREVEVSELFHRQWTRRISAVPPKSVPAWHSVLQGLWGKPWMASATAGIAVILAGIVFLAWPRKGDADPPALVQTEALSTAHSVLVDQPRTFAVYHHLADHSLEALDQLLTEQAPIAIAGQSYRVSSSSAD